MILRLLSLLLRWGWGLYLLWKAWQYATLEQEESNNWVHLGLAAGAFILALILTWPEVYRLATSPLLAWIDRIYLPKDRLSKPILNLKLPMHYLNEGRYAEAEREYRSILRHYPREAEPYERLIWIDAEIRKRPERSRRWYRLAKRRHVPLDPRIVKRLKEMSRQTR